MKRFTSNIGRGIRAAYKNKPLSRQSKRRQIHDEIEDSQFTPIVSPVSESAGLSPTIVAFTDAEDAQEATLEALVPRGNSPQAGGDSDSNDKPSAVQQTAASDADHTTAEYAIETELPLSAKLDGVEAEEVSEIPSEQALRTRRYLEFEGEDETDYTAGPVRIVDAFDGVKDSGAILMTLDFSASVQRALRAQRDFAKSERVAARQFEVAVNFEGSLITEITNHMSRLGFMEDDEEADKQLESALREELSKLEMMLQDSKNERQVMDARQHDKAKMLREIQVETNRFLEEAFVFAKLLEPESDEPDTPIEERDLQQEYQIFCAESQGEDGAVVPLDTNREYLDVPPLSPGQQAREDLKDAFWDAKQRVKNAQTAFDRRDFDRAMELQANHDAVARGEEPMDTTPEDFDVRWVVRIQELTHELLEAEGAFAEAKATAVAADIDLAEDDTASGFVDDVADGYRMSFEQAQIDSVPGPKVSNWLSNIPDQASPTSNDDAEVDDNWETQTVDINDSISMVAEDPERRRIDKWKRVCGF